jgi:hypothetical protein
MASGREASDPSFRNFSIAGRFRYDGAKIAPRQVKRLHEIADFFDDEVCFSVLIPMVTQTFEISLRLLDWFLVNWSKKHKIVTRTPDGVEVINIYSTYKDHLRHYRRRLFDPFRRRERIYFAHSESGDVLNTTVGQLNFIFWALKYGILECCRKNIDSIENDMVTMLADSKKRRLEEKRNGKKRKRTELTQAPRNKCHVYIVSQEIDFECHSAWDAVEEEESGNANSVPNASSSAHALEPTTVGANEASAPGAEVRQEHDDDGAEDGGDEEEEQDEEEDHMRWYGL